MTTAAEWSFKVGSLGELVDGLEELSQGVRNVVLTRIGESLLEPEFGLSYAWLDLPMDRARPLIIQEVSAALDRWEKRITVLSVTVRGNVSGSAVVAVRWRPNEARDQVRETSVLLAASSASPAPEAPAPVVHVVNVQGAALDGLIDGGTV